MKNIFIALATLSFLGLSAGCRTWTGSENPDGSWPGESWLRNVEQQQPLGDDQLVLPELTESATLDDYLHYAAVNNPALRSRYLEFKAAVDEVVQAGTLPDPEMNFEYALDSGNSRIGIMQMFPWFGTLAARSDAATARARAAGLDFEAAGLALAEQVGNAYAEYVFLSHSLEIARENLALIEEFEAIARVRLEAGRGNYVDVVRAQLELSILNDAIAGLEQLRPALAARLNAVLHRPIEAELPWPKPVEPEMQPFATAPVFAALNEQNRDLAARQQRIEAARQEIILAQKRSKPNLGVGLEWMNNQNMGGDDVMLMFSMNLPLWRVSYRAAEQQARARAEAEQQARQETKNQLLAQTRNALYELADSQRKLRLYNNELLPMARELIAASEAAYQEGNIDFPGLIDAQRQLLQYQLEMARASVDNLQTRARLFQLTGGNMFLEPKATK